MWIYLLHIFVLAPLLIGVGIARNTTPDFVFNLLGILAALIFVYHSYLAYKKLKEGKSAWVNWIHIFLIVPLFAILARFKKEASRRYFEMLMMLGFAAVGYHGFYLIRDNMFA
jgi:hypothetical protein